MEPALYQDLACFANACRVQLALIVDILVVVRAILGYVACTPSVCPRQRAKPTLRRLIRLSNYNIIIKQSLTPVLIQWGFTTVRSAQGAAAGESGLH